MTDNLVPGEIVPSEGTVTLNEGRETAEVTVGNTGDRPVQVGSHFHFFEANAALAFDREAAYGQRVAHGMNGMVNGSGGGDPGVDLERLHEAGFEVTGTEEAEE